MESMVAVWEWTFQLCFRKTALGDLGLEHVLNASVADSLEVLAGIHFGRSLERRTRDLRGCAYRTLLLWLRRGLRFRCAG